MEEYALASHQRAARASDSGAFRAEIVPCGPVAADECPRRDTSLAQMAALPPLRGGGLITAALASQIADAAAALWSPRRGRSATTGCSPGHGSAISARGAATRC